MRVNKITAIELIDNQNRLKEQKSIGTFENNNKSKFLKYLCELRRDKWRAGKVYDVLYKPFHIMKIFFQNYCFSVANKY